MSLFVTIEGVEGCGKTTIGKLIVEKLIVFINILNKAYWG